MPSNAIMNIMGGYVPKVRIERVSLSNGGKLIVEDNPHIVEQETDRRIDRAQIAVEGRNFLMAASDDEKKRLFKAEYDREVVKQTAIATRYKHSLRHLAPDLGINYLKEMLAIRNFLVEYGLKAYAGTLQNSETISRGLKFVSETPPTNVNFQLIKNEAAANEFLEIFTGNLFGLGAERLAGAANGFQIMKRNGIRDKVRTWIDRLTLPRMDSDPITLDTILPISGRPDWRALVSEPQDGPRPLVRDATTAVLYVLADRVLSRNKRQIETALGLGPDRVITAQATTAESSGQMTVDLLLNVKNVVDSNGIYKSWLSKPGILDHLEFGIIETTNLDAIELARNSNTSGDTMETWLRTYGIGFRYDDAESFLSQDLAQRWDPSEPTLIEKMSLKAAMESNGMEEAIRNPQIDSDGNQVQTFTFRIQNTFAAQPSMLAYYIIPYLNVPKFITSLEASNEIELDMDTFLEYKDLFIGSMTRDLILKKRQDSRYKKCILIHDVTHSTPSP